MDKEEHVAPSLHWLLHHHSYLHIHPEFAKQMLYQINIYLFENGGK